MRRLNRATGVILRTLSALVLAAGLGCGSVSNPAADAGVTPDALGFDSAIQCEPAETICNETCVDTQTSEEHCGECGNPCAPAGECMAGECANPLAAIQTEDLDNGVPGDLFVLQDITLQRTKLDTATFATGRVRDHAVLADGSVVMVAAETTADTFELYHVQADGSGLMRISSQLPAGRGILPGIAVSRDGSTILYRSNQDDVNVVELYVVKLANPGTSHKVNGALVAGGSVTRVFGLSANGDRAAYVADQQTQGLNEAFMVDLSGATPGASTKLNPTTTEEIYDLAISGDGDTVVYRQDEVTAQDPQLFVVATSNPGTATRIPIDPNSTNGTVLTYQFSPTDDAIFFVGGLNLLEEGLWRAPLSALTSPVELVPAGVQSDPVREDFVISSDGQIVYYRKATNLFDRLYRVSVANPGSPTLLSNPSTDSSAEVTDFAIAPDGSSIVFRTGADGAEGPQSQPHTDGPLATRAFAPALQYLDLTNAQASIEQASLNLNGENGIAPGYLAIRNGGRAIYRADHDAAGRLDAYLSTPSASQVMRVSPDQGTVTTGVSALSGF